MCVGKIVRSSTIATFEIVLLLLCFLNLTNGQQSVYSIVQRESLEGVREEPGGQINDMPRGPNYSGDFFPLLISVSIAFLSSSSVILE